MADQIATAGKRRLHRRLGSLGTEDMAAVGRAIRTHLKIYNTGASGEASSGRVFAYGIYHAVLSIFHLEKLMTFHIYNSSLTKLFYRV